MLVVASTYNIAVAVFLVVCALALGALWLLFMGAGRSTHIRGRGELGVPRRRPMEEVFDTWVRGRTWGERISSKLTAGGVDWSAGRFMLVTVAATLVAYVLVALLLPPLFAVVAAVLAARGCFQWLNHKVDKRKEEFIKQLPDIARLLGNGASAGLSIPAALELVVREIGDPAKSELQETLDEISLGSGVEVALENLEKRLPSREVSVLITTLIIQQRSGGDAVQALQELSHTLEQRRENLREIKTLLAGAVFTSYLVPLLGVGALLLLNTINSQTLHRMSTQPVGLIVLAIVGGMYAVGSVMIRKVSRIDL